MKNTELELLKDSWLEEKNQSPNLTFTMFVYRWQSKISSLKMLKELHKYAGLMNFASWKQVYFKNYPNSIKLEREIVKCKILI